MKMEKVSFKSTFTDMYELFIGGSALRKILGFFISAKHYEKFVMDIFQSEVIFFKTILLH